MPLVPLPVPSNLGNQGLQPKALETPIQLTLKNAD